MAPAFACPHCGRLSTSKGGLRKHIQNIHKLELPASGQRKYDCDECSETFFTLNRLKCHYEEAHNYRPVYEERRFRTMAAFKTWKQKMESETGSRFIAQSAAKKSPLSRGKVLYLACCRSGHFKSHSTGKRKLKSQGSVKCGRRCFASMTVVEKETGVSVVFQATHRGHDLDLRHVLLSDKEKTAIASKLHKGVSLDTVLDSVRERFEGTLQRVHLLARQDLNVLADSRPDSGVGEREEVAAMEQDGEEEEDECLGVLSWVERMGREEDNPVLYFKQRGQADCAEVLDRQPEDLLVDDDFMLVLMTHPQLELLRTLGGRRICIDWTRGAPGIDLQLLTVVCVDGSGGAFPVAYCVMGGCQVERRSALTFLRCVRAAHGGPVEAEALVSDDVPALFSAWQEVMGQPRHCFLCAWSVDRAWRENIKRRIPRKKLQAFAYKALRTVMDASTEKQLEALQEAFVTWCSLEGQKRRVLTDFVEYFRQNYAQRAKVWAACYRRSAGLGSSVRLEALHKVLEHCCLRGGENQRVDRLVPLLLRLTRNKVIDRLAKCNPNAEADFRAETRTRHEAGLKIPRENVSCAGIGQWTVRSASDPAECYVVACQGEPCREACAFACPTCQVCAHNTTCSCPDSELRRNICPHIHAVFARTAEVMDVVEESLRACEGESPGVQPSAAEDIGGGHQSEEPSSEALAATGGDGETPTMCALLLHAIGQQLRHPCVEEKATPWLQPLLAAILERLNACAAAHRVSLSYVVNKGVLASTDLNTAAGPPAKGGAQLSDGDVARAVLSIGQPALPADRPAAPAVVVRTVEPPLSTNHRPILPAMKKVAQAGMSARRAAAPTVPARVTALPATDPASQTILVGIPEPPNHKATHTIPAGLAKPAGSAGHPATQTIFVKVAGPPPVLANQEAVHPALKKVPASTASASHEATRTVFVPAAPAAPPLATQNVFVRTAEPPVSPSHKVVHTVPARMAKPAGSLATGTVLVGMSQPPPSSTSEAAQAVLARASEAAAICEATSTVPARIAQPGAQTIFVMGAPPQAKGDEVVCLVPLQMAEALAASRQAAHSLPPGVAKPPVPANHLAAQTLLARTAEPAVSANNEAVHTVPQRPALSVGQDGTRTVFVLAEPQAPTSREARRTAPAEVPKPAPSLDHEDTRTIFVLAEPQRSTSHEARHTVPARVPVSAVSTAREDTRTVFVLAEPQVSTSHEARHTVPARIPQSAVSMDHETTRGVFVLSEPQVSTSRGTRHGISAGIPKSAVSVDREDTRTVFVLAEPQVSASRGTKNSVPATVTKPAGSVDHEDTRTVFVLAQPPVSSGHQATHSVPAGIFKPASHEDSHTVFVLAEPERSSYEARLTVPARIPKSALSLDREATRTGIAFAEPQVSSHDARQSVPARTPKPVSVDQEGAHTVFVLAQPPVSTSLEHGVPAKMPKLAVPLDPDDTRTVFVLAQPQMSTNCEATPARTAGPALPLDHKGSHVILVPVAEPPVSTNHKASRSISASIAEPPLSPSHEAAHTILTMAAPAKPAGRRTIRSILKATQSPVEAVPSTPARLAEHAVPMSGHAAALVAATAEPTVSMSPNAGGFAFVRMTEPPASISAAANAAEPRLSPSHEAAHTILKMADPSTSTDHEAPLSTPAETAGSLSPASQGATPSVFAATADCASPTNPEAVHPDFAVAVEGVVSTSSGASTFVSVGTAGPLVLESHKGVCNILAIVGKPGLSPNSEAAHTILAVANPATSAGHEASVLPSTAGSSVPASSEAVPTVVIKVEEPEAPSSPEGGPLSPTVGHEDVIVRTADSPMPASHGGPCSVSKGTAVQAALGKEDCALATSSAPCSQADHDYCSNPPSRAASATAFPWTANLVQHSPSSR